MIAIQPPQAMIMTFGTTVTDMPAIIVSGSDTLTISIDQAAHVLEAQAMKAVNEFINMMRTMPFVEHVVAKPSSSGVWVTTYVNGSDEQGRFSIYDAEDQIQDKYPSIDFDFHVMDRKGQRIKFTVPDSQTFVEVINTEPDQSDVDQGG